MVPKNHLEECCYPSVKSQTLPHVSVMKIIGFGVLRKHFMGCLLHTWGAGSKHLQVSLLPVSLLTEFL